MWVGRTGKKKGWTRVRWGPWMAGRVLGMGLWDRDRREKPGAGIPLTHAPFPQE